jgi:hypothetical protein
VTPGCGVTLAGTCTSLTQTRAFMVITLGTAAIVMFHHCWLEVRAA